MPKARPAAVRIVNPGVGPGSSGQSVRVLQEELSSLRYAVPLSGTTARATRKMPSAGLPRWPASFGPMSSSASRPIWI